MLIYIFCKNLVKFTCFFPFPLMFILTLSVLYFFPFGKNIVKFDFFIFKESLLVWNQVVIFGNSSFISSISVSTSV